MKVKVKYLNWDKKNPMLMLGRIAGVLFENPNCYRDVTEFELCDEIPDDYILANVFEVMNRIDDDDHCKVPQDERSMCVGDLLCLGEKTFVVTNTGFRRVA